MGLLLWRYIYTSYSYTSALSKQCISYIIVYLKQLLNVYTTNFVFLLDGSILGLWEGNHLYFRSAVVYSNISCFLNNKYIEETNV